MTTGTGKTRKTMDAFMQGSWVQKVLFLADRDALVEQALNDGFYAIPSSVSGNSVDDLGIETTGPRFGLELTYEGAKTHPRSTRPSAQ
jgi:type I site-specific restriction endonuclease